MAIDNEKHGPIDTLGEALYKIEKLSRVHSSTNNLKAQIASGTHS